MLDSASNFFEANTVCNMVFDVLESIVPLRYLVSVISEVMLHFRSRILM